MIESGSGFEDQCHCPNHNNRRTTMYFISTMSLLRLPVFSYIVLLLIILFVCIANDLISYILL